MFTSLSFDEIPPLPVDVDLSTHVVTENHVKLNNLFLFVTRSLI